MFKGSYSKILTNIPGNKKGENHKYSRNLATLTVVIDSENL